VCGEGSARTTCRAEAEVATVLITHEKTSNNVNEPNVKLIMFTPSIDCIRTLLAEYGIL
jgi:hypothetical protein